MSNQTDLKFVKLPFFICALFCDLVLIGFAYVYAHYARSPMGFLEAFIFVLCGASGAAILMLPFVLEYRAAVRMVETGAVVDTITQVQNIEEIARQIGGATAQWQVVQEHSTKTASVAKELADRMSAEAAAFTDFLKKAHDSERANLRVEIEKLRRAEGEFLQVIVRMLDHTYALNQAAVRSGQPGLIEQLGNFQNALRDTSRRIGLVPYVATIDEAFDPQLHEAHESKGATGPNAKVRETIATGYTYQGKLLRPALVALQNPAAATSATSAIAGPEVKKEPVLEEPTLL